MLAYVEESEEVREARYRAACEKAANRQDRVGDIWERRESLFEYTRYVVTHVAYEGDGRLMGYGDEKYMENGYNRGWMNHMRHDDFVRLGFVKVARGTCGFRTGP